MRRDDTPIQRARRTVVMLAAEEPTRDPRVHWAAILASRYAEVTLVGLADPARPARSSEMRGGYRIVRASRNFNVGLGWFLLRWLRVRGVSLGSLAIVLLAVPAAFGVVALAALSRLLAVRRHRGVLAVLRRSLGIYKHFASAARALDAELRRTCPRPDLIHCNDLDTLLVGVIAKRALGCALVYDAHEFWPYLDPDAPRLETACLLAFERRLIREADHVTTVSPMLAEEMLREYALAAVKAVPNCEPRRPAPPPRPARSGPVSFLFQGIFAAHRGIEDLVDAWKAVDPARAVLILRGPQNACRDDLERRAAALGVLGKGVHLAPPVAEAHLVGAAAEADVGVIPYRPVGLNNRCCCPNKLSQYMQAGLAILCNDLPFVKEVVERYRCGLAYDAAQPETLVAAIARLSGDRGLLADLQRHAAEAAATEFCWEEQSREMAAIYEQLTATSP